MIWFLRGFLLLVLLIFWMERAAIRRNLRDVSALGFKRRSVWWMLGCIALIVSLLLFETDDLNHSSFFVRAGFAISDDLIMFACALLALGRTSYQAFVKREPILRGIAIFAICITSMICMGALMPFHNPQRLTNPHLTHTSMIGNIAITPLVGLGEESFKLLCIVGVFVLLRPLLKKRLSVALLVSGLVASLMFGQMHTVYWGSLSGVYIGSTSVIMVLMIVMYRNVWIPMLAHMTLDAAAFYDLYVHRRVQTDTVYVCIGLTVIYLLYLVAKAWRARRLRDANGWGEQEVL